MSSRKWARELVRLRVTVGIREYTHGKIRVMSRACVCVCVCVFALNFMRLPISSDRITLVI